MSFSTQMKWNALSTAVKMMNNKKVKEDIMDF